MIDVNKRKTISPRQLAFLLVISLCALRTVLTPSLIVQQAGQNGYISFFICAIVSFAMICLILYIIEKNKGKPFDEILKNCFGKLGSKIIMLAIAFFCLYKILATDFGMEDFLLETLYEELNWNIFIIPLLILFTFLAYKGVRVLGRVAEMILFFGIFVAVFAVVLAIPNIEIENLLPFCEEGFAPIFNGAVVGFSLGGEYLFLLILCENLEKKQIYHKKCLLLSGLILLFIFILMICFIGVFGNLTTFLDDAITKVSLFSRVTDKSVRVDSLIISIWIPIVLIYSAINFYCTAWCLQRIFNIKNFAVCTLIVLSIVVAIKFMPFITIKTMLSFSKIIFPIINASLQILLPISIVIIETIKNRRAKVVKKAEQNN